MWKGQAALSPGIFITGGHWKRQIFNLSYGMVCVCMWQQEDYLI